MNKLDDICRFPLPALNDLPEDIRDRITEVNDKSGFIPNIFMVLARRPEAFRALLRAEQPNGQCDRYEAQCSFLHAGARGYLNLVWRNRVQPAVRVSITP